jgi:heavy metal sensor kinase
VSLPVRARLTAWYLLLLAVVLAGVGLFVVERYRADLSREIDRALASSAGQIAHGFHLEGRAEFLDVAATVLPALPAGPAAAQVLNPRGDVLVSFGAPVSKQRMIGLSVLRRAAAGTRALTTVVIGGEDLRVFAVPVDRKGERDVLVVGKGLSNRDHEVSRLVTLLLIALPGALLAAALGGWLLARRALRPVERMTSHADRIGVDHLSERVPVPAARDELSHLAETLNRMLERLERGVDEKRRLVANASHELRTPLAAMQAELDVSLRYDDLSPEARETLRSAREEVERMSGLVANLLTLATIDEGRLELRREEVDLGELARSAAARFEPMAERAGVRIEVDAPAATAIGDVSRLREVLSNLVVNAINFSGEGAEVRVATWASNGEAGFSVGDTGPGMTPEAAERAFERFWRADRSRSRDGGGSGLGLAICREIVEAHGGRIEVESAVGEGTRFTVALAS